jgi:DNA-binding response OmpR family regulator
MALLLIVDGDDGERARTADQLRAAGHEVDEAPDGVEAFEKLLAVPCDLVISEAELARLALADLIAKLRGRGVKTPVLVLTSVTKGAVLSSLLKAGAIECLHKASPIEVVLRKLAGVIEPVAVAPAPAAIAEGPRPGGAILLVDPAGRERERLRALLPAAVALEGCGTIKEALARGRAGSYRVVLFDLEASVVNVGGVVAQLRVLQPEAAVVALVKVAPGDDERTIIRSAGELGFDDVVCLPAAAPALALLVEQYCTPWSDLVSAHDDAVVVSRLRCRAEHRDRYLHELTTQLCAALPPLSEACYDRAVLDLTRASELVRPTDAAALLAELDRAAGALGIAVHLAWPAAIASALGIAESLQLTSCRLFGSLAAARA